MPGRIFDDDVISTRKKIFLLATMTIKDDPDLVLHASGWDYPPIPKPEESFFAITGNESQVLTVRLEV